MPINASSRSPVHRIPWWVLIWIRDTPVVFLVLSVACFSVGLVLLPYSLSEVSSAREYSRAQHTLTNYQGHATCIIVSILTAFTSFGFVVVFIWMALERWVSIHHDGQKWLADVLQEANSRILGRAVAAMNKSNTDSILPIAVGRKSSDGCTKMPDLRSPSISPVRLRFIGLVRKWIVRNISPERRRELMDQYQEHKTGLSPHLLKSTLRTLTATDISYHHGALVRHLQFSPDGRFLATSRLVGYHSVIAFGLSSFYCSWDRTAVILRVAVSQLRASRVGILIIWNSLRFKYMQFYPIHEVLLVKLPGSYIMVVVLSALNDS